MFFIHHSILSSFIHSIPGSNFSRMQEQKMKEDTDRKE